MERSKKVLALVLALVVLSVGLISACGKKDEAPVSSEESVSAPAEDAPAEDAPAEDAPAEDAPAEDAPAEDAPADAEAK